MGTLLESASEEGNTPRCHNVKGNVRKIGRRYRWNCSGRDVQNDSQGNVNELLKAIRAHVRGLKTQLSGGSKGCLNRRDLFEEILCAGCHGQECMGRIAVVRGYREVYTVCPGARAFPGHISAERLGEQQ